jgi:predicted metal-binding membrane protein
MDGTIGPAFGTWAAMMAAMMSPTVLPTLRVFARASAPKQRSASAPLAAVMSGYLAVWLGFSAIAAILQHLLEATHLLSATSGRLGIYPSAALLAVAGAYQWSLGKQVCLRHCRSPMSFILSHWRPGILGSLEFGVHHGLYCLGCCVFLMSLLFVGGSMNLAWMVLLSALVLAEKTLPFGETLARAAGAAMIAASAALVMVEG